MRMDSTFGIVIRNANKICAYYTKNWRRPLKMDGLGGFFFGRICYYGKVSCEFLGEISPRANSWAHGFISQQFCPFVVGTSYPQNLPSKPSRNPPKKDNPLPVEKSPPRQRGFSLLFLLFLLLLSSCSCSSCSCSSCSCFSCSCDPPPPPPPPPQDSSSSGLLLLLFLVFGA